MVGGRVVAADPPGPVLQGVVTGSGVLEAGMASSPLDGLPDRIRRTLLGIMARHGDGAVRAIGPAGSHASGPRRPALGDLDRILPYTGQSDTRAGLDHDDAD